MSGQAQSGRSPDTADKQRTRDGGSSASTSLRLARALPARTEPLVALDATGSGPLPPAPRRDGATPIRLLTARAVADTLGVCTETVLRWVRSGELPAIRLPSGAIRIGDDELEAWLKERATPRRGMLAAAPDVARAEP